MKIKVVSNYDSDENMYKTVSNCFENNTSLRLVKDESYDKLVVINGYRGKINVSRDNIIGILQEPIGNINYDRNLHFYCSKIICQSKSMFGGYGGIREKLLPMFYRHHETVHRDYFTSFKEFENRKKLCLIVSSISRPNNPKWKTHNYQRRHNFVKRLLNSDLEFDFYGRGWNISDPRYKGSIDNKHETLRNYEYSIAIENVCENNYVSEKFFDCILNNTVPLYYGCPNVESFYDPNSFYNINTEDTFIVDKIRQLISQSSKSIADNVLKSKELYFKNSNIFDLIKETIDE